MTTLTNIQSKILQPFVDKTLESLTSMAKMSGYTEDGFVDDVNGFRFKGNAIAVETEGHIDGVILMHHYDETALAMGNAVRHNMLGEENNYTDVNDDIGEALVEFSNTAVGLATRTLSEEKLGIKFSPPSFVADLDTISSLLTGVTEIITVPVHVSDVGRFYFNYLIRSVQVNDALSSNIEAASSKKILVVDDMKMVRKSMKRYLSELGYTNIIEAENGAAAVEMCGTESPDFLFMDIVMPELNGNQALAKIRESNKELPIVMLTSVADEEVITECENLGIDGYIIKPLTMDNGPETLSKFLS